MKKTIFDKSEIDQAAYSLPKSSSSFDKFTPREDLLRKNKIPLPEVSELNLMRHFVALSKENIGIDNCFYPLGSCTMKYNPRINEQIASLKCFTKTHPLAPDETVQGNLEITYKLISFLCDLTGMTHGTLLPNAGAQGEYVGVQMIRAYHLKRNDIERDEMLVPASAHGTNPATAAMAGYKVKTLKETAEGDIDLDDLKMALSEKTAGLMLTNPNTLGLFSKNILTITKLVHEKGALLYYDGANLNPTLGIAKPFEMGFDVMHINLHKTFSTPHGGGGPGSAPVLCNDLLSPYLPVPKVIKINDAYKTVWEESESIGHIASFRGNFSIYLRAYLYTQLHGFYGLRRVAENAILNANYLKHYLQKLFKAPFKDPCMHEFVLSADRFLPVGVKAVDVAKALLDKKFHAPTVYFPNTVKECLLIEPTECESKSTLDVFIKSFQEIVEEIEKNPEIIKKAPEKTPVGRLNEVKAAKDLKIIDPFVKESQCRQKD